MSSDDGTLVYSTGVGRISSGSKKKSKKSKNKQERVLPKGKGIRVARETKGRKGKGVTIVTGFELSEPELVKLHKELKALCGAGGTLKDGVMEIQGEHRDRLVEALAKKGYSAKKSGG